MSQLPGSALPPVHEAWLPREHSLHRPRHGGRQLLALLCALVFFTAPLIAFAAGVRPGEIENRKLATFPSPTDGWSFFTGLSPWATDHLALRREAIQAADSVSRGVFGEPPPLGTSNRSNGPLPVDQTGKPRKPVRVIPVPQVVEGKDGWLYLGAEIDSKCNQIVNFQHTFKQLRKLRDGVEASGRQFVLVVAPDKLSLIPEYLPDEHAKRECLTEVTEQFWQHAVASGFTIDLRPEIETWGKALGRPIYPRLDAHWTDEGAVLMARALAERAQPGVTASWVIKPGKTWRVPADLPPLISRAGDADGQFYSILPDGKQDEAREIKSTYKTPLKISSAPMTGKVSRKVGLLADSFTIRALRYLPAAFSDLTVLHYGSVLNDNGLGAGEMLAANEVVALEAAERILVPQGSEVISPEVVDTIIMKLLERPLR